MYSSSTDHKYQEGRTKRADDEALAIYIRIQRILLDNDSSFFEKSPHINHSIVLPLLTPQKEEDEKYALLTERIYIPESIWGTRLVPLNWAQSRHVWYAVEGIWRFLIASPFSSTLR